jgi:hypothetical protein
MNMLPTHLFDDERLSQTRRYWRVHRAGSLSGDDCNARGSNNAGILALVELMGFIPAI